MRAEPFHFRAEYFEIALRVDYPLGRLYWQPIPPRLIGPGESRRSVEHEVPNLEGWRVEDLKDEAGRVLTTFARVTKPNGEQIFVPRERAAFAA